MQNKENNNFIDDELTKSFRFQNRELLDNYVILAVTNKDGIIKHVSTNLCNIFSFKESDLLNKPYTFLIKKDFITNFENEFEDSKTYKSIWKGEVKHSSSRDRLIWTDTIITPLFNDDDEHIGFILASNDITQEKKLKKINDENMLNKKHNDSILDFMPSISAAVLLRTSSGLHKLLWIILFTIIFLLGWAHFSKIDDIVKSEGKVITTKNIQNVSTLDGGILEDLYIKEGDIVKKDELLLRISSGEYKKEYEKSELIRLSLIAKIARLKAQSTLSDIKFPDELRDVDKKIVENEYELYVINKNRHESSIEALKQRLLQKKSELKDNKESLKLTRENYSLLRDELKIKRVLVEEQIVSKVEYFQLKRKYNETYDELQKLENSIPSLKSAIKEINKNIEEKQEEFKSNSKDEMIKSYVDLKSIEKEILYFKNKVENSLVLSPSSGVVNSISVKTKGEAISPGKVLVEIIPNSDNLLVQVKISPAEIGFLFIGQKVKLKVRAFDFSLYGGIDGMISYISADTLVDEKDPTNEHYIVQIKADKNYVGDAKELLIKPGMSVDADIITGKKSILDFILKPIIRSLEK